MGEDCCSVGPDAERQAAEFLVKLKTTPEPQPKGKGKSSVVEDKDHKKHVEELQGFIHKRIKLFEEYKQREDQAVCPPN